MTLKNVSINPFYSGGDTTIGSFYSTCFSNSKKYQRLSGYFSSGSYEFLKKSIADFATHGGKIELVCSPNFKWEGDVEKIQEGYALRQAAEKAIQNEIYEDLQKSELNALKYDFISALIGLGTLDIKIAYKTNGKGIFHSKISVFTDSNGDFVTTIGSNNETTSAIDPDRNWESFSAFQSWSPGVSEHASAHKEEFESHWNDSYEELTTIAFPDHSLKQIEALSSGRDIYLILEEWEKSVNGNGQTYTKPLPRPRIHQTRAIEIWKNNDYRGIFRHATGSGKTVSAMMGIREWFKHRKGTALITVPSKLLLYQWEKELVDGLADYDPQILLVGDNNNYWKNPGLLKAFTQNSDGALNSIVIGILASIKTPEFLGAVAEGDHLLVVSDEVHNNGSKQNSSVLSISSGGRLGLSATPERYSDPEGTQKIMDYFGGVVDSYTLQDAIKDGHLTKYQYFPHQINLTADEIEEWRDITIKVKKAYAMYQDTKTSYSLDRYKMLAIQRARIVKGALNKSPVPSSILNNNYQPEEKWIVYCDDNVQLQTVKMDLVKNGYSPLEYHYQMDSPQQTVLDKFEDMGGILLSINCLDEGIDIPSLNHAIILSSSKNPRQFIQRRGRVLRKYPGKFFAKIYDCIVVPPEDLENIDTDDTMYKGELLRAYQFSQLAINSNVQIELLELATKFGYQLSDLMDSVLDEDPSNEEEPSVE